MPSLIFTTYTSYVNYQIKKLQVSVKIYEVWNTALMNLCSFGIFTDFHQLIVSESKIFTFTASEKFPSPFNTPTWVVCT